LYGWQGSWIAGRYRRELPDGMSACIFRGGLLVDVRRDKPPQTLKADELCWFVPAMDVPIELTLHFDSKALLANAIIRFEADTTLSSLLHERTEITSEDLSALVTSEFSGLLDVLGHQEPEELEKLTDESRERLRAKLSLLLQIRGLRCVGISGFRVVPLEEELDAGEAKPEVSAAANRRPIQELTSSLADAIGHVKTDSDWEHLLGELEACGLGADETLAIELDELGERVVAGRLDAKQVASRIREMAESASNARASQDRTCGGGRAWLFGSD